MNSRIFVVILLCVIVTQLQAQESAARTESKFKHRGNVNPFDLTQPQASASIQSETSVTNKFQRRRMSPARLAARKAAILAKKKLNEPEDQIVATSTAIKRRIGSADGTRRRNTNRKRTRGRPKVNSRKSLRRRKNNPQTNDVFPITPVADDGMKIVCYYTNWSQYRTKIGQFLPEHIDPFICTHIIYAFGWLKKGRLSSFDGNDLTKDGKIGFYEQITGLKKKNPKLKILLALGGWTFGTKRFKDMAGTRYSRQIFILSAIPFLRKHNFDGLDLDWEYPSGKNDMNNLNLLVKELIQSFEAESLEINKPRFLLTAAVSVGPDKIKAGYDVPTLSKYLDFINVMAYDFHGKWENTVGHNSPMFAPSTDSVWRKQLSVTHATELWHKLGAPKEKLVIGMSTYGRSFTLVDPRKNIVNSPSSAGGPAGKYTGEEGFLAYYEVCEMLHAGGHYVWDTEMQVPYMVMGDLWVGFDDERSIRNKMDWINSNGYGGAMIWSIDMDDFLGTVCGGNVKYPLISIMAEELRGKKRNGKDVDWAKITKTSIALEATPAPPLAPGQTAIKIATSRSAEVSVITSQEDPKIVCYFTSWANKRPGAGRFLPTNIDPFLCTHVIYAFVTLTDHRLSHTLPSDIGNGISPGTFELLVQLKEKNPQLKIMVALGGWAFGSKPFQDLVSNQFRMNGFVYDAVEFLRKHELDGLDIDWEYPKGFDDKANYVNLLTELRIAFEGEAKATGHPRLLLSAAVPASFQAMQAGYDVPEISKYLDFMNVMTYDFHGQWEDVVGHNSPLFPIEGTSAYERKLTVDYSIRAWMQEGAPAQKIVVGMPMYGRSFTLNDTSLFDIGAPAIAGGRERRYTKEEGFMAYYEICDFLYEENTTLIWDNEQHVPFAYNGNQWVGFDDERSLGVKAAWLKDKSLGGVMLWSVDMDDFRGNCGSGKYPLLNVLVDNLGNYTVPGTYEGPYENTGTSNGKITKKDPNVVYCDEAEGVISYHNDVNDCTKYFMCHGERKHHMPCPVNLVFNVDQSVCDWPENVAGCENAITGKRK